MGNAQEKTLAKPKVGIDAFTKDIANNVVFPTKYYDNGGLTLRIAVDSLANVKLVSINPRDSVFFNEVKTIVENSEWVPGKVNEVKRTSIVTLPIKLNKTMLHKDYRKAEPKMGIIVLMKEIFHKIPKPKSSVAFKAKFIVSKEGQVSNVVITPFDEKIDSVLKTYLETTEWYPAIENDRPVQSVFTIPLTIKIN